MAELISALMVTLAAGPRFELLKQSIEDFRRQTHPARELVVVVNGGSPAARRTVVEYVGGLADDRIRLIEPPGPLSLGALRNVSVAAAHGDYVCQWDDDDRHHPDRMSAQLRALKVSGRRIVLLEQILQIFPDRLEVFCLNWRTSPWLGFPASMLAAAGTLPDYPETGERAVRGEDTAMLERLAAAGEDFAVQPDAAHLYLYRSHGANTWPGEHHAMLARTLSLSAGLLRRREPALRAGLRPFAADLQGYVMHGSNGPAFSF